MIHKLGLALAFLIFSLSTNAQIFYPVYHATGTVTTAGVKVTVKNVDNPCIMDPACGTGPYWIGCTGASGFTYTFESAFSDTDPIKVLRVRADLTNVGMGEVIRFEVNGQFYPLAMSNLSPYSGSCILSLSGISAGKVISPVSNSAALVTIDPGYPIDSVTVYHENALRNGTHYTFTFYSEPKVYLDDSFYDTVACHKDSMLIPYMTTAAFDVNNIFNIELSDAAGDFTNPVVIGSSQAFNSGTVRVDIPPTIPRGKGYRYRITASHPARTSLSSKRDIMINPYPTLQIASNSPVCSESDLQLSAQADEGSIYSWSGRGFSSSLANPVRPGMTIIDTGTYIARANLFGCVTTDSTRVAIKPLPSVKSVANTGPVCVGDNIQLSATSDYNEATLRWTGPLGVFEGSNYQLTEVEATAAGTYSVSAVLNECNSKATTTVVVVKPLPAKPVLSHNSPIFPGDPILLKADCSTPGVTYSWKGPLGFTSNEQNPIIANANSGHDDIFTATTHLDGCIASHTDYVGVAQKDFIGVYPNPSTGVFNIKLNLKDVPGPFMEIPIHILNQAGQLIQQDKGYAINGLMVKTITLRDDLLKGVYFIRMGVGKKNKDVKVMLDR